jgi:hypothetical protein
MGSPPLGQNTTHTQPGAGTQNRYGLIGFNCAVTQLPPVTLIQRRHRVSDRGEIINHVQLWHAECQRHIITVDDPIAIGKTDDFPVSRTGHRQTGRLGRSRPISRLMDIFQIRL